jgi:phenylacetate-CoA ligase
VYWDKTIETIPKDELAGLQLKRLRETLKASSNAPFYKDRGLADIKIESLEDISKLPFTVKQDLRDSYPYRMLSVPLDKVVRLHSSSGTTGIPTVVYHSRSDIDLWAGLVARCMYMAGVRQSDVFQNMIGYGLFTGGLGLHYGAEKIGCLTIPSGPGNTKRQLKFMKDYNVTAIHIIPSYALHLADTLERMGIDPKKDFPHLKFAFVGAEPYSEETRKKIEEFFGMDCFNSYGLSEMCGPGVAFECPYKKGMHIWEDAFLVEILDPLTLEPVKPGETGELVLTTLTREAMPILRYRTKDLTSLIEDQCECGRTHHRIRRITGRSDDMIILKGVNIFPVQIEEVLISIEGVRRNYQIILLSKGHNDHMIVKVEVDSAFFVGDATVLASLRNRIVRELHDEILLTPEVELCEPDSLPYNETGKAVRVIDKRDI